ncbi:MAG: VWA domain-containing protein [Terrimicrobiaceae bacterium]|nr:VWA domain-containing protein [Terrimicrobiaceae bacterium]
MKTDSTDITFLLDRSGSMQSIREAAIAGFNRFVADQRAIPGDVRLTLIQFDDQYEVWHTAADLLDVPELTADTFEPRGSTALLDAMGRAITGSGQRLAALPESERPEHVIFVTFTDGMENASREFTWTQVQDLIREQTGKYAWDFLYLGANQDAIATAAKMGIARSSSAEYCNAPGATGKAYGAISKAVTAKRLRETAKTEIAEEDRGGLMSGE